MGEKLISWFFCTVLFSLLPLMIYGLNYLIARGQYPSFVLSSNLYLSAIVLSVGAIKDMSEYKMIDIGKKLYFCIFIFLLLIVILASYLHGTMLLNVPAYTPVNGSWNAQIIEENIRIFSIMLAAISVLLGTLIQIFEEVDIAKQLSKSAAKRARR